MQSKPRKNVCEGVQSKNELATSLNFFENLGETPFSEHQFLGAFIFNWFLFCSGLTA